MTGGDGRVEWKGGKYRRGGEAKERSGEGPDTSNGGSFCQQA